MDNKTKKIWDYFTEYYINDQFNKTRAIDFAGCECIKSAYADENSNYNWALDHIYPKNVLGGLCGNNCDANLQVVSMLTNEIKGNNLSGIISIEYTDKKGEIIKTIHTKYEIKKNPIFSNINKNGIRLGLNVNGIVYIKKQYDSNNRIYLEDVYFYDSLILIKKIINDIIQKLI